MKQLKYILMIVIASTMIFGCAKNNNELVTSDIKDNQLSDPFESINRKVFAFNNKVDKKLLRPVAKGYRVVTNDYVRGKVNNVFSNLKEPITFANQILQGKINKSAVTLSRFAINSTVGLLGINDPATKINLEKSDEDFGQTLASWGVTSGPYIVVPFWGPATPRHLVGKTVDIMSDPVLIASNEGNEAGRTNTYYAYKAANIVADREKMLDYLDDLEATSADYYTAIKSAYNQNRREAINDGEEEADYEFDFDIEE